MDHQRGLFVSIAGILAAFGTLMVYSASITAWPSDFEQVYLSRHLVFLVLGGTAAAVCASLPAGFWFRAAPWLFTLTVALLAAVLVPGLGVRVGGAQRWLRFGLLSIQPSELAKIALPLLICRLLQRTRPFAENGNSPNASSVAARSSCPDCQQGSSQPEQKQPAEQAETVIAPSGGSPVSLSFASPSAAGMLRFAAPVGLTAVLVTLVAVQPDLGTALFLACGAAVALFVAGWPLRAFLMAAVLTIPPAASFIALRPYQMKRLTGLAAVWTDFNQAPYQLRQSLISFGAGGLLGSGLGNGWQKLSFLPEANTDFVFAVVGEELGLAGTLTLITLWAGLYGAGLSMLRSCRHEDDERVRWSVDGRDRANVRADRRKLFNSPALPASDCTLRCAAAFTLLTGLVFQAALNMAVAVALVPPKGIPLPLISYGGSNLVTSLMSLGIILSLTRTERTESEGEKTDPQDDAACDGQAEKALARSSVRH